MHKLCFLIRLADFTLYSKTRWCRNGNVARMLPVRKLCGTKFGRIHPLTCLWVHLNSDCLVSKKCLARILDACFYEISNGDAVCFNCQVPMMHINQKRRQKIFDRGLYVCAGGLDILKFEKKLLIRSAISIWGVEILFGGLSPPKPPVPTELISTTGVGGVEWGQDPWILKYEIFLLQ